ncbi:MAG: alpha/beta hydrolase [Acidimicrobiales bacterium]|jgi:pimeloyl-ACP methyl ester carboxylesterase
MRKSFKRLTKTDTILVVAVVAVLVAVSLAVTLSTTSANTLKSRVLAISDLPTGWTATKSQQSTLDQPGSECLAGATSHQHPSVISETASFYEGLGLPVLGEYLAEDSSALTSFAADVRSLATCHTLTFSQDGHTFQATIAPVTLGRQVVRTVAYSLEFTDAGLHVVTDLVLFATPKYLGEVIYSDSAPPSAATVTRLTSEAIRKAEGQTIAPFITSITAAPVRIATTAMGAVGYREFGSGPPLVMIMGYGGTMETWDPRFIDALAQHHRVIVFDNAGIGATQAVANLSIDAMANQTSALIDALGLKRPDVFGWSMGGMIAQALAVEHPTQVRRLVLSATFPGLEVVKPSQGAINDLRSSNTTKVMSVLFPANQASAVEEFEIATSDYPPSSSPSAAVVSAQTKAVDVWFGDHDVAGRKIASIKMPTLVADGDEDLLDPVANAHTLARLIPGARLVLYPDAGHAFLFQDQSTFVPVVDAFLNAN